MDTFITIVVSFAAGIVFGTILGFWLCSHIHNIAQAAADRISHIGMVSEPIAPLQSIAPTVASVK